MLDEDAMLWASLLSFVMRNSGFASDIVIVYAEIMEFFAINLWLMELELICLLMMLDESFFNPRAPELML